jgi:hypothetical protein
MKYLHSNAPISTRYERRKAGKSAEIGKLAALKLVGSRDVSLEPAANCDGQTNLSIQPHFVAGYQTAKLTYL